MWLPSNSPEAWMMRSPRSRSMIPFCDHLPAADAQRAIFCDIGNVIFYRGKELVLAVKLPPAGRREMDAFFFQEQNQVKNLRRRALGLRFVVKCRPGRWLSVLSYSGLLLLRIRTEPIII